MEKQNIDCKKWWFESGSNIKNTISVWHELQAFDKEKITYIDLPHSVIWMSLRSMKVTNTHKANYSVYHYGIAASGFTHTGTVAW